jgi:hypothetical protein
MFLVTEKFIAWEDVGGLVDSVIDLLVMRKLRPPMERGRWKRFVCSGEAKNRERVGEKKSLL